ncbi:ABC transporter ATP-binding protein [Rubinisphaera italica]|uniref:ABC-type transporter ATP-binding protein EcsA n=1 Tax=Rubinisphaera italica TaxID=2527969 RepID=A0A5C5XE37_9PLAN|nr:ABC transporter ATP-binding protein [Rubinisphaera italica]TWT61376.1 ABC-type transporter ATP-binding protein EcsA [Rubinisphaera italica]
MIELEHVWQHYGVRPVLKDVSVTINPGELVAILGPNGMGKSTLMGVIAGTISPLKGTVRIEGNRRRGSVEEELEIRSRVIYVPDHPWLPIKRTGREFALSVARLYDVDDERLMMHLDKLLKLFDLDEQANWTIESYSNGQKHKIALIAALLSDAPILLLDEAFSGGLDPAGIHTLKKILRHRVQVQGSTVVITTPVAELVEEVADRILILHGGEVVAYDSLVGLQKLANCHGSLNDVLQNLTHPESLSRLEDYLREELKP